MPRDTRETRQGGPQPFDGRPVFAGGPRNPPPGDTRAQAGGAVSGGGIKPNFNSFITGFIKRPIFPAQGLIQETTGAPAVLQFARYVEQDLADVVQVTKELSSRGVGRLKVGSPRRKRSR